MRKLFLILIAFGFAACAGGPPSPDSALNPIARPVEQRIMPSARETREADLAELERTITRDNSILFGELEKTGLARDDITASIVEMGMYSIWSQVSEMNSYHEENRRDLAGRAENIYPDSDNIVRIDRPPDCRYFFQGRVTKNNDSYYLSLGIQDGDKGSEVARFTGTFTKAQIDDQSAVRQAARDLLERLGKLTPEARAELSGEARQEYIEALTLEARGLAAGRSGDPLVGFINYASAARLRGGGVPDYLKRLLDQMSTAPSRALGSSVREDLEMRAKWKEALEAIENLLSEAPPYALGFTELTSSTNYRQRTADISMVVEVTPDAWSFDILRAIQTKLNNLGKNPQNRERREAWGFADWPRVNAQGQRNNFFYQGGTYQATLILRNERGDEIGRSPVSVPFSSSMSETGISSGSGGRTQVQFKNIKIGDLPRDREPIVSAVNAVWNISTL